MDTTITIRSVTVDDVAALREIRLEALRSHPTAFTADYKAAEERSTEEWQERIQESPIYFACDKDAVVGMSGFFRSRTEATKHHGWIWGVYVQPAYRGYGIAGAMIERSLRWAREQDLKIAYIAAAATNTAAVRCYARCGFSVYGLQPKAIYHDGRYYDELLMAQEL